MHHAKGVFRVPDHSEVHITQRSSDQQYHVPPREAEAGTSAQCTHVAFALGYDTALELNCVAAAWVPDSFLPGGIEACGMPTTKI